MALMTVWSGYRCVQSWVTGVAKFKLAAFKRKANPINYWLFTGVYTSCFLLCYVLWIMVLRGSMRGY